MRFQPYDGTPIPFAATTKGDRVTITETTGEATHLVQYVAFSTVDYVGDRVRGLASAGAEVTVRVKPGSDRNPVNCHPSNAVMSVAILTTPLFDATSVDHTTVTFEGASETHVNGKTGEPLRHEEDVDEDGDTDLVFHFRLGDTSLDCAATEGTLRGDTFDGQIIEGTDAVSMVG